MNQCVCSQLLPAALSLIGGASPLQPDVLRPAVSFITSCIANNGKPIFFFRKFFFAFFLPNETFWLHYNIKLFSRKFFWPISFFLSNETFWLNVIYLVTSNYRDDPGSAEDDWRPTHISHCSEGAVSISGANQ